MMTERCPTCERRDNPYPYCPDPFHTPTPEREAECWCGNPGRHHPQCPKAILAAASALTTLQAERDRLLAGRGEIRATVEGELLDLTHRAEAAEARYTALREGVEALATWVEQQKSDFGPYDEGARDVADILIARLRALLSDTDTEGSG